MRRFIHFTKEDFKGIDRIEEDDTVKSVGVDEAHLSAMQDEALDDHFNDVLELYNEFDQYRSITLTQESMDADTAYVIGLRLENVKQRLQLSVESIASVSHFENPHTAKTVTEFAMESITNTLRKIWRALKEAFLKAWNYIKNFFVRRFNGDARYKHHLKTVEERIKKGGFGRPRETMFSSSDINEAFSSEGKLEPSFALKILDNHISVLKKSRENVRKLDGIYDTVDESFKTIKTIIEEFISITGDLNNNFLNENKRKSKLNYFADTFDRFLYVFGGDIDLTEDADVFNDIAVDDGFEVSKSYTTPRLINNKAFYIVYAKVYDSETILKVENETAFIDSNATQLSIYVDEYTFLKDDVLGDPDEVPVLNGTYITSIHSKFTQLNELLDKYDYENIIDKIETKITKYFDDYEKLQKKFYDHVKSKLPNDIKDNEDLMDLKYSLTEIELAFSISRRFMKDFYSIMIEIFHNVMRQHLQARDLALSWVESSLSYYDEED